MIFTGAANLNGVVNQSGLSQAIKEECSESRENKILFAQILPQYVYYCRAHVFNLVSKYLFVRTS